MVKQLSILSLILLGMIISVKSFGQPGVTCDNPYVINAIPFESNSLTTDGFGNEYDSGDACESDFMNGNDFVFAYTATSTDIVTIQLSNTSNAGVGLFLLDNCPDEPNANCIASSEGGEVLEGVTFISGVTYYIIISTNDFFGFNPSTPFDIAITKEAQSDVGIIAVEQPVSGCGMSSQETLTAKIVNYGINASIGLSIAYTVNNGTPVEETISQMISPGDTVTHSFANKPDLSQNGLYSIAVYTLDPTDEDNSNDTLIKEVVNKEVLNTFPYFTDFEDADINWTALTSSSWEQGIPEGEVIDTAYSGNIVWATNLDGDHNSGENSSLETPCYNFTYLVAPIVKFKLWYETDGFWDAGRVTLEFSIDNGNSWNIIGSQNSGQNWYNSENGWSGSSEGWLNVSHVVPELGGVSQVKFRIHYTSGMSGTNEGLAVDDFEIIESPSTDVGIVEIIAPSGACGHTSADNVTVRVANAGIAAQTGFDIVYQVNGNTPVVEPFTQNIAPGDTLVWSFNTPIDLSAMQYYEITAYTSLVDDADFENDTATTSLTTKPEISVFPYFTDFEAGDDNWNTGGTGSSWEVAIPVDTFIINEAYSGDYVYITNPAGNYNSNENSYIESPCLNFSSIVLPVLKMKLWYETESFITNGKVSVWASTDGGQDWQIIENLGGGINWYAEGSGGWGGSSEGWLHAEVPLNNLGNRSNVLIRVQMTGSGTGQNEGVAIDDIEIIESPAKDLGIIGITSIDNGCGMTNQENITVKFTNYGIQSQSNYFLVYEVNNQAPIVEPVSALITPGDTMSYTFTQKADLSVPEAYSFTAYSYLENDEDNSNDTTYLTITHKPIYDAFPYIQDFESGADFWTSGGTNKTWELATPASSNINSAVSGTKAWITNADGSSNVNENSYIESPCFDLSALTLPVVRFNLFYETGGLVDNGYSYLESSIDGGITWQKVGTQTSGGINWYNSEDGWSGGSGQWLNVKHNLDDLIGENEVKFRVHFHAGFSGTNEGVAVDDFELFEHPQYDIALLSVSDINSACNLGTDSTITVSLTNFGTQTIFGFDINFSVNGSVVSETYNLALNQGDTIDYTFSETPDLSVTGEYEIKVFTSLLEDEFRNNDTLSFTTIHKNTINTFPYIDDFESNIDWSTEGPSNSWEKGLPSSETIQGAYSGNNAWATNLTGNHRSDEYSYVVSPCFDFTNIEFPAVRMKIWYKTSSVPASGLMRLEQTVDGENWQTVGSNQSITPWYNISGGWHGDSEGWLTVNHVLDTLAGEPYVQFRLHYEAGFGGAAEGVAVDDFEIYNESGADLAAIEMTSPLNNCGLNNAEVSMIIENQGLAPQHHFDVAYSIDNWNTSIVETVTDTVYYGESIEYTFTQTAALTADGTHYIQLATLLTDDENTANDTIEGSVVHIPTITGVNYYEDFEAGEAYWTIEGNNATWEYGTPNAPQINEAASGDYAFVTNLTGNHAGNESSALLSPCFNMSSYIYPIVSFDIWYETDGITAGGISLESSFDNGETWTVVGEQDTIGNWYNSGEAWNGSSEGWITVTREITDFAGESNVKFRIAFEGGIAGANEGVAIDNFRLYQPEGVDIKMLSILSPGSGCGLGSNLPVSVEITNTGLDTIFEYTAGYAVDGDTIVIDTISDYLAYNQVANHVYSINYDFSALTTYSIDVWVNTVDDDLPLNNSINDYEITNLHHDFAIAPYIIDFEAGQNPVGSVIDNANSDSRTWIIDDAGGIGSTACLRYNSHVTNTADDRFYTRCFALDSGEVYKMSYFYQTGNADEELQLRVGFEQDLTGEDEVLSTETIQNQNGFKYTEALFEPDSSAVYYFNFRVQSNSNFSGISLDHIVLSIYNPGFSVDLGEDDCLFQTEELVLSPGANFTSYLWFNGTNASDYTATFNEDPQSYWVEVIYDNITAYDEIIISSCEIDTFDLDLGPDTCLYIGDYAVLSPNLGDTYEYVWSNGETTEEIYADYSTEDQIFWVDVTDPVSNLTLRDSITVSSCFIDSFTVDLGPDTCLNPNNSFILNAGIYGDYSYEWSTGSSAEFIPIFFTEQETTYWLEVTDNVTHYSYRDSMTVSRCPIDSFEVFIGQDDCLFSGDSILLTGEMDGPFDYQWSTGSQEPEIYVNWADTTQTIWLQVQDTITLYTVRDTAYIHPCDSFTIELGEGTCLNEGEALQLNHNAGDGPFAYQWSTGETSEKIWIYYTTTVETYGVTVTDTLSGLLLEDEITYWPCDIDSFEVYIGEDQCLNPGSGVQVHGNPATGPYTYQWSTGATGASTWLFYDEAVQYYTLYVTDTITNLTISDEIMIYPCDVDSFTVNLGPDTCVYEGYAHHLSPQTEEGPYAYQWSTGETTEDIWVYYTPTNAFYSVTVTDTISGLSISDEIMVGTCSFGINLGDDFCIEQGDSASVDATIQYFDGEYEYLWSTGDTVPEVMFYYDINPQTVWVRVTDIMSGQEVADTLTITPCPIDSFEVNLGNDTCLLEGQAMIIDAEIEGPYIYSWSNGSTDERIIAYYNDEPVTYYVTVTDTIQDLSIVGDITVSPCPPPFVVNLPQDTCLNEGEAIILDTGVDGAEYQWNTGESTRMIIAYYDTLETTYRVLVTDLNSDYSAGDSIVVSPCDYNSIDEISAEKVLVYPNPATEKVFIVSEIQWGSVELRNVLGQKITQTEYYKPNMYFDINNLQPGIYNIKINYNNTSVVKRIIVK